MRLLNKTLNNALKVENITLSPGELVSVAEARLLANCTQDELKRIQKGVQKTWVLAVGSGSSTRYYPSASKSVQIIVDFGITHLRTGISLWDKEERKEYFLPKGKENIKLFQALLLQKISERLNA